MEVEIVPLLEDNFTYLLFCKDSRLVVDPSESQGILKILDRKNLSLDAILLTHHHADHVGGVHGLARRFPHVRILGPALDAQHMPFLNETLTDGDSIAFGEQKCLFYSAPCHTRGHGIFSFPQEKALFTGDALFVGSMGRFFEGTAQDALATLETFRRFPEDTRVFCGHEYSLESLSFAHTLEPSNLDIQRALERVRQQRSKGEPTVPSTLKQEYETNPFLRLDSEELLHSLSLTAEASLEMRLRVLREQRNTFSDEVWEFLQREGEH